MEIDWTDCNYSFRIAFNRYGWVIGKFNFVAVADVPDSEVLYAVSMLEGGDDESIDAAHIIFSATGKHFVATGGSPVEAMQNLQKLLEGKHG